MRNLLLNLLFISLFALLYGCKTDDCFNKIEIQRVKSGGSNSVMPLLTINQESDSLFLRQVARQVRVKDIGSKTLELLRERMLATVNDSLNSGVGIAAPQVGVSLRMIYVQRFDKQGEPFEIYYNPEIVSYSDSTCLGREGCLSVPYYRGIVERSASITLNYFDYKGKQQQEKINGFTSVIFQHETDHINGILYYDRVDGGFEALTKIYEL